MIDQIQFLECIIKPALDHIDLNSPSAQKLLLGTAIQESRLTYLKQLGDGPALGFFQMEPATEADIKRNYLQYRDPLMDWAENLQVFEDDVTPHLIASPLYAAAMCRIHYFRQPESLPALEDTEGMAKYWKKYYNTHLGRGTVDEYMHNWERYGVDDGNFWKNFRQR